MSKLRYILWLLPNDSRTVYHGGTTETTIARFFPATPLAYRLCRPQDRSAYIAKTCERRYVVAYHNYRREFL